MFLLNWPRVCMCVSFILRRMGKNKAKAPTLPRVKYMCVNFTLRMLTLFLY